MLNEDHPVYQLPIPKNVKVRIMPCLDFWIPTKGGAHSAIVYFNKYFDRVGREFSWRPFVKEKHSIKNLEFTDELIVYGGEDEYPAQEPTVLAIGASVHHCDASYFIQKEGDLIETAVTPIVNQALAPIYPNGYHYNECTFEGVRTKSVYVHAANVAVIKQCKKLKYVNCDLSMKDKIAIKNVTKKKVDVDYED